MDIKLKKSFTGFNYEATMILTQRELHELASKIDTQQLANRIVDQLEMHIVNTLAAEWGPEKLDKIIADTIKKIVNETVRATVEERVAEFFGDE
jgi:hypothetical protein